MTLQKLTPNQDLQCFFFEPTAIAALSATSTNGFTVSGTWRQQFDWAVIEWNRDNTHEHPALRSLPDGDLSGLTLSYKESRTNCIPMDSDLFHTVSWPFLRVWAPDDSGAEQVYQVPLFPGLATAVAGSYAEAYADFTVSGTITAGDFFGIAYLAEHFTYPVGGWEGTLNNLLLQLAAAINTSVALRATVTGNTLRVYYTGGVAIGSSTTGANGNKWAVYSYACSATGGASTLSWDSATQTLANGTSPTQWQLTIPFNSLSGYIDPDYSTLHTINHPQKIRKLRWTYAADLQAGAYSRTEFQVVVSDWAVTGTGRDYAVAGPGSVRVEDDSHAMAYSGSWSRTAGMSRGNYSGGTIHLATTVGDEVSCTYAAPAAHELYLGTRYTRNGGIVSVSVDGSAVAGSPINLQVPGEDVLVRWPLGSYAAGSHTVTATLEGGPAVATGNPPEFWFDFVEAAVATATLPAFADQARVTLATDWDTEHSLALSPERTAWLIDTLGFKGRANHYVGALWFYELVNPTQVYSVGTVTFTGGPDTNPAVTNSVTVTVAGTALTKLIHMGDTVDTLATAYANELNRGYMSFRAVAAGNVVTIYSRSLGMSGDAITLTGSSSDTSVWQVAVSGANLTGGADGIWLTDLAASPRLNRAVRDWTTSYFAALHGYGIDAAGALSMELKDGDQSVAAGIAQRGPVGSNDAIVLPTPSVQTNFSPASLAFWQEAYAEIAAIQAAAGLQPFLQFGEVQWWYFPTNGLPAGSPGFVDYGGMPFYDAYTQAQFLATYGSAMATITANTVSPASYPNEVAFLPGLIANFTNSIMSYVRAAQPACRFEVLYPGDVNQTAFNQAINFPAVAWTPAALTVLKTEGFGFTLGRNLDGAEGIMQATHSFPAAQRAHLVGIGDSTTAWLKEARSALGKGFESVVLFALDQFCLIGYALPFREGLRRSVRMGS